MDGREQATMEENKESGSEKSSWKKKKEDEEALRKAVQEGDTDRVKQLLAGGVNPNAAGDVWQITSLHLAAENGHHETVSVLLTAGADVNARNYRQFSPLHRAAGNGHHETVSVFLTAGADVNARDEQQYSPLHWAAVNGHHETLSVLLTAGADVNARGEWQESPLHQAAWKGHHETVSVLLTAGADVNSRDVNQVSPLHQAACNGHHEIVSVLLTAGADVNARDVDQESPLHWTAWKGHHETLSVLLTAGADVNARNEGENTPLHDAATRGHPKCAEILLQYGADAGLRNKNGRTAEDIAADEDTSDAYPDDEDDEDRIIRGRKEILKLLRQKNYEVSTSKKEYDPVLVRFYEEREMTVARKDCPLIQEAAKESGKTVEQVMNFIGNYRKSKGGSKRRPPPDTMERKRRITGYHEYYREQLPRKRANREFSLAGANKEIGESWKNLTDEEKEGYNKAAERRRGKETKVKTSSEVAKKLKQLEKLSEELDDLGVEALMVTLYNGRIRAFGSQKDVVKDEKFGGYIENQLKAAEHQRKAAQCLTMDRGNSDREGSTGTTRESHDVTRRPGSSTSSVSKRRKKNKEAQQGNQQNSSSAASLPSASSTQESAVTTEGHLPRTTDMPHNTGTPVHVVLPNRATSTPARPNTGNLELLAQQSATHPDLPNSLPASPHNTETPVQLAPQATPTESQTGFHYFYRSDMPLELLVPQTTLLGSTTVTTGGLPHRAPQIHTAASLGTSVPSQGTPTVRQAPTGVSATNGQFPHSPLVFAMPHYR